MKHILPLLCFIGLISLTLTANGIDLFAASSVSTFTCLKNAGNSYAIIRAFRSSGIPDANANNNLQNAKSAGLAT
jgi:hypothetical protein